MRTASSSRSVSTCSLIFLARRCSASLCFILRCEALLHAQARGDTTKTAHLTHHLPLAQNAQSAYASRLPLVVRTWDSSPAQLPDACIKQNMRESRRKQLGGCSGMRAFLWAKCMVSRFAPSLRGDLALARRRRCERMHATFTSHHAINTIAIHRWAFVQWKHHRHEDARHGTSTFGIISARRRPERLLLLHQL